MSNLDNQLAVAERDDVSRGIRTLLASPLISENTAPETFDLIRRRAEPIRKWFDYYCGWSVLVEPRLGYVRLAKVRPAYDASRPARRLRSGRAPFDRRRYVLLCVGAAELLAVPVTTVGLLADRVARATSADPAIPDFDTSSRGERMAFVDVLRLLESYGAIEVVDGATESYVDSDKAKVLYQVDSTLLMRLLAAPVGISQLAMPLEEVPLRLEELLVSATRERRYRGASGHSAVPVSDAQRNLWLRHSVFRRLADDPVVHFDELTEDERGYLASPTGRQLLRRAAEQGGFGLEERAEGVMLVDPEALATDTRFPDDSSNAKVAALTLLDRMAGSPATIEQLNRHGGDLLARFPRWAKSYQGEDGAAALVSDAVAVLVGFGLVRREGAVVRPLPAAARYLLSATRTSDDVPGRQPPDESGTEELAP
ncbi:MAG TPA: TIGR02678 family protein [Pseudonocardia sp.]|uniref:TIGR02678 family protein n=1 Tax=Pseudonocardia sp. TaxID=60912 RepID=UPI002F42AB8F